VHQYFFLSRCGAGSSWLESSTATSVPGLLAMGISESAEPSRRSRIANVPAAALATPRKRVQECATANCSALFSLLLGRVLRKSSHLRFSGWYGTPDVKVMICSGHSDRGRSLKGSGLLSIRLYCSVVQCWKWRGCGPIGGFPLRP